MRSRNFLHDPADTITIGNIQFKATWITHDKGLAFHFLPVKMLDGAVKKGLTKLIVQTLQKAFPKLKGTWERDREHPAAGLVLVMDGQQIESSLFS